MLAKVHFERRRKYVCIGVEKTSTTCNKYYEASKFHHITTQNAHYEHTCEMHFSVFSCRKLSHDGLEHRK